MTDDRLDKLDYYTLLGITDGANIEQVRVAFRQFARKYHPDRFAGASLDKRQRADEIFRRGSEAVQVLTDPLAKRAYDMVLRGGLMRLTADARDRAVAKMTIREAPGTDLRGGDTKAVAMSSTQARVFYEKAKEALDEGHTRVAWRHIRSALEHEPDNATLLQLMRKIETKLRSALPDPA